MARPREFNEDNVLNALKNVFWKNGFEGTSYSDIMDATGLKKGSLYAAYGDKRALYKQALERYNQDEVKAGVAMLTRSGMSSYDKINTLFSTIIQSADTPLGRRGCLLCNAAIDQAPFDPDAESVIKAGMQRLETAIQQALSPDHASKSPHILAAYFGMRVMVKAGLPKDTLTAVRDDVLSGL